MDEEEHIVAREACCWLDILIVLPLFPSWQFINGVVAVVIAVEPLLTMQFVD